MAEFCGFFSVKLKTLLKKIKLRRGMRNLSTNNTTVPLARMMKDRFVLYIFLNATQIPGDLPQNIGQKLWAVIRKIPSKQKR